MIHKYEFSATATELAVNTAAKPGSQASSQLDAYDQVAT